MIAGAAIFLGPLLAEIPEQGHATAAFVFGKMRHLLELHPRLVARLPVGDLLEKPQVFDHIAARVEEQALGRQSVAPGASGFLVVALHVLRQVGMDDEAHVGFVDPHTERDGGANDLHFVAEECLLVARPFVGIKPRVVRRGFDAGFGQGCGE